MSQSSTALCAVGFLFQSCFVLAGGLDIFITESISEIQFELAAFVSACYSYILSSKMTGGTPIQGFEKVAY
jgi:hypothetical protein